MPFAEILESRKSQLALAIAQGKSIVVWARKKMGQTAPPTHRPLSPKLGPRSRRFAAAPSIAQAAGWPARFRLCFGRNMLWRQMNFASRGAKRDTGTLATLNCNLLLNHAQNVRLLAYHHRFEGRVPY